MFSMINGSSGTMNLQQTLSASTSVNEVFPGGPHHPITCNGQLSYEEDGTFRCEHAVANPEDLRTKQILNHSLAILLIELAFEL